ncbi:1-acyl-sn-glycerol-3-phosphate acyltransferase [Cellulomonas edaphi]|uniref:1-acyl-sn-glycerol-3-phosphate acyltransferase n=1 Tax=Cellulomonas edaphi TaxID=3053468 RepID=A0ABT7S2Z2_9CELL|nr:1-acyl-sn-glycerol-3-phosphate acyltransferase [Cellulomons edaphi]MDM7829986.1 1-acyl-sn-glycerol-3-phosphate acyltransferase [Cellulomons edaphi]
MNWRLPPRWVRRLVLWPLAPVLALVLLPVGLILFALVGGLITWLLPGRLRLTRILWMAVFYIFWDATVVIVAFALWVGSGFGWAMARPRFQRAHYVFAGRMLQVLFWQVRWTLRLSIEVEEADVGTVLTGRPIIVASRHAGPGDSFILVHALLNWFAREPLIVLKDTLQWDPAIDILLNRLPTQFITPHSARRTGAAGLSSAVGDLAAKLDTRSALLIFPEGGNVTPRRRVARIAALREKGREDLAVQAEQMVNVMAPHAGGLLAALDEAPEAGVVFVAHTGLDRLVTTRDIWRELPMDKRIIMKGWPVDPAEIPRGRDAQEEWLFASWLRTDRWIAANDPTAVPDTV